ncbi:MAG: ATP-binding cassette domain-containing protein, partial [Spirochaetes bacterium]|nr:ATP-binding cassette domain-containing protein [Spirochaetota bacterium]
GADTHYEGNVKYGTGISAGYFSQDAAEAITGDTQVIDFMEQDAPTCMIPKLRDMLGSFLFQGDDVYKSVSVLSGGEKSRLALLKILLKPLNLLILDEPTNHLDLNSKDILLEALSEFGGTVIFVSHDRYFMEALSTKTLELVPGTGCEPAKARLFYGNYAYYLDRISCEAESAVQVEVPAKQKNSAKKRIEDKQKQAHLRRLERHEEEILKTLKELENAKAALETELALPEVYGSVEKARAVKIKLDECNAAIEAKTSEWEEAAEEIASI